MSKDLTKEFRRKLREKKESSAVIGCKSLLEISRELSRGVDEFLEGFDKRHK